MTKKKQRLIGIKRTTIFNGQRKVGIDSYILIRIYEQPFLLSNEASRIFNFKDTLFTHVICLHEFIKKLKSKGLDETEAIRGAKTFLQERNIKIIYSRDCFVPEKDVNEFEEYVNNEFKKTGKTRLKCHKPDSIIILAFEKTRINKVFSTDESFRESANLLGIDGSNIPTFQGAIAREFRKLYSYNKYKKKRR